jgi:hypothetical protein
MQLGASKIGYTVVYGISPFFSNELRSELGKCNQITIFFDESLNRISQQQQMDIAVPFWNSCSESVETRYLTSMFLGHTTAVDLLKALKEGICEKLLKSVFQISMDGPNVNWKLIRDFKAELQPDDPNKRLLYRAKSSSTFNWQ